MPGGFFDDFPASALAREALPAWKVLDRAPAFLPQQQQAAARRRRAHIHGPPPSHLPPRSRGQPGPATYGRTNFVVPCTNSSATVLARLRHPSIDPREGQAKWGLPNGIFAGEEPPAPCVCGLKIMARATLYNQRTPVDFAVSTGGSLGRLRWAARRAPAPMTLVYNLPATQRDLPSRFAGNLRFGLFRRAGFRHDGATAQQHRAGSDRPAFGPQTLGANIASQKYTPRAGRKKKP